MMKETVKTTAEMVAMTGRVIGLVKSNELARVSLCVPGDRAVLNAEQCRALALWLTRKASEIDKATAPVRVRTVPNIDIRCGLRDAHPSQW